MKRAHASKGCSSPKNAFDVELDLLLSDSRKRSSVGEDIPAKRIKTEPNPHLLRTTNSDTPGLAFQPPSTPLALRRGADGPSSRAHTLRNLNNTINRQWDPSKDDLEYEFHLDQRRKERLSRVDRYVPGPEATPNRTHYPPIRKKDTRFPLQKLPEDVLARVFEYLLVGTNPVTIDFYWLRSFVNGHTQVPNVMQSVDISGRTYTFPVGWNQLLTDVQTMKDGMDQFKKALEMREMKTRAMRSPCRGLATALLRVSRKIHKVAAGVFYSKNTFRFPCTTSAWIQLDSFLITIGALNANKIQHLQIHAPMWHRLIQEDFVEGAIIDSLSPATRMGVMRPAHRDRVLSAIQGFVQLCPNIKTLKVELASTTISNDWAGRYVDDKRMIAACDADEHAGRKAKGIELLMNLSAKFPTKEKPTLTVCNVSKWTGSKKEFHKQLPGIRVEAMKYGWYLASSK